MKISVVIPVYNEAAGLESFLQKLQKVRGCDERSGPDDSAEIVLVDGGSADGTAEIATKLGFQCVISPKKGRAAQMNYGAEVASGDILYFLHADTIPPDTALNQIEEAVLHGVESGCFRLSFDDLSPVMRFYAWFTRFDLLPFRFGDQSLFVRSTLFHDMGGFREDHIVMEDNEFMRRLRKRGKFVVFEDSVVTSARKYQKNGFVRLQLIFMAIYIMYYLGVHQETLVAFYRDMISDSR